MRTVRSLLLLVALSVGLASPAMAQTGSKKAAKGETDKKKGDKKDDKKTDKKDDKKGKKKAEPEPEPEPEPKKEEKKPKKEEPEPEEKPEEKPRPADDDRFGPASGIHFGLGLPLGIVLSRENAAGSINVLGPQLGLFGTLQYLHPSGFVFRAEPSFTTFKRKASQEVLRSVDATRSPPVVKLETLRNEVRELEFSLRLLVGYRPASIVSMHLGGQVGLATGSTGATQCETLGPSRSSVLFGGTLIPALIHVPGTGEAGGLDVGPYIEYSVRTMPQCTVPAPERFEVKQGELVTVEPKMSEQSVSVLTAGLRVGYLF